MSEVRLARRIETELAAAEAARSAGQEGRARVCARRAAGLAAGAFLERRGVEARRPSAVDRLRKLQDLTELSVEARQAAGRLTARVDRDHRLPHAQDPLQDARELIAILLETEATRGEG